MEVRMDFHLNKKVLLETFAVYLKGGVPVANGEMLAKNGVIVVPAESLIVVRPPVCKTPFIKGTPAAH